MIKINLLPIKEAKKKATIQNQIIAAGVVFLVVIAGVVYIGILRRQTIQRLNQEIVKKNEEIKKLKEIQKKVEEFKKANAELKEKKDAVNSLETGRDWYLQILDQLSEAMPENVWIETLSTPKATKTGSIYSGPWEIKGGALEEDQVGTLISNLESRKDYFASVTLKKITKSTSTDLGTYFIYELTITVTKPPKVEVKAG